MNTLTVITPTHQEQPQGLTAYQAQVMPLAELFARFIVATGRGSKHTARNYQNGAGAFLQWLGARNGQSIAQRTKQGRKTVWEIRGDTGILQSVELATLDEYAVSLQGQGNQQNTINVRLGAVNSFLRVALRDKVISRDQGLDLDLKPYKAKQKRNEQPVGRRLSREEVRTLRGAIDQAGIDALEANRSQHKALRDMAILDFMLYAGLRREEVANLDLDNFKLDGGRWWIVLTGKGNKTRRLKVHDKLFETLGFWLAITGGELGNGDTGPVFYNLNKAGNLTGNRLNPSVIGRLVAEYGHAAGLAPRNGKNRLSPHDLRRTCARNAYDNGATIYQVQNMLGHADPKTTIRYIGALEDDSNTAVDHVNY